MDFFLPHRPRHHQHGLIVCPPCSGIDPAKSLHEFLMPVQQHFLRQGLRKLVPGDHHQLGNPLRAQVTHLFCIGLQPEIVPDRRHYIRPTQVFPFDQRGFDGLGYQYIDNRFHLEVIRQGIQQAAELGCDVLVTGTYWNQVQTEIGQRYRDEFEGIRDGLAISLVECSHYASEAVVMRTDVVALCERFGLACEFVPQDDPWY